MDTTNQSSNQSLSDFAFLIGRWECKVSVKKEDGKYKRHYAGEDAIVRITFFDIKNDSFSWKADVSRDNEKSWEENVFTIEANKVN